MTQFLSELVNRGLVTKLDGDDRRLAKIQAASEALAVAFTESPGRLLGATLAGIDPDVPADDPAIRAAEEAVIEHWSTMRSIHPDSPINILRAVLLDACFTAGQGPLASIVWLTAVDQLRFVQLGPERDAVHARLAEMAVDIETQALEGFGRPIAKPPRVVKLALAELPEPAGVAAVEEGELTAALQAALPFSVPAQNWQGLLNATQKWMNRFPASMAAQLAKLQGDVAKATTKQLRSSHKSLSSSLTALVTTIEKNLNAQRKWLRVTLAEHVEGSQVRLDALWWSEALYSSSLQRGYRQLPPALAAFVMSFDLVADVSVPTPASVGYLLAETIAKLPAAGFDAAHPVRAILDELREHRQRLPAEWLEPVELPDEGRPSLRDLAVLAVECDGGAYEAATRGLGSRLELRMSLPEFGHAVYRQEQALRVVRGLA